MPDSAEQNTQKSTWASKSGWLMATAGSFEFPASTEAMASKLSNFYWNNDKHLGPFRIEWQLLDSVTLQDAQARIPCCFGTIKKA